MDYNKLLDLVTEIGYRLAMSGAETYRIEESINRILKAYGIDAAAFSIPNCLIVSIQTAEGKPMTRMRRVGQHGNDLDAVERYSNLSRRICSETPDPEQAHKWLQETIDGVRSYGFFVVMLANFLGALGFAIYFSCSFVDSLIAGICGIVIGFVSYHMDKLKANHFFRIILAAFFMSLLAYSLNCIGLAQNADGIVISALMLLVPGLLFTNALRDIIYGDTNSGVNRIVQVFLIAIAIALGTGAAWSVLTSLGFIPVSVNILSHPLYLELIGCAIACLGFSLLFNIKGPGCMLCMAGGMLVWIVYCLIFDNGGSELAAYFGATFAGGIYAEIMARIRKYPAISYLLISVFPLIPGGGLYYAMNHAIQGNLSGFTDTGLHTLAIAGVMAVGMLIASTIFRIWSVYKYNKQNKRLRN